MHSEWEKGRRNLATGSINTLQTAPINEMLSFHFSRFCLSQSQGSRREREFCPLNLEVRDENEIFLSISQGSRRDRDIFFQVSCFEMGLRDEINQILTRIFEIEKSRYALNCGPLFSLICKQRQYLGLMENVDCGLKLANVSDLVVPGLKLLAH